MKVSKEPNRAVVYTACRNRPADKPVYKSITLPQVIIVLASEAKVGFGLLLAPLPASCSRTFIMSMGWMIVVATISAEPPFMNGSVARINGVCNI